MNRIETTTFDVLLPLSVSICVQLSIVALALLLALAGNSSAATATLHVDLNSTNPISPYADWPHAARDIQSAVDAAANGDTILVTNGIYATGERAASGWTTNRVTVDKPVTVLSVNGPKFTMIAGHQLLETTNGPGAIRCVSLADQAVLSGFTLTQGATEDSDSGGGAWCESAGSTITNCILTANSASSMGGGANRGTLNNCSLKANSTRYGSGGGAANGTLNNCLLTVNTGGFRGGGAFQCTLNNCTLAANSAFFEGGAAGCGLTNCIVYFNTAGMAMGNYDSSSTIMDCCCTTPMPIQGTGNLTNTPLFVDIAAGDLHLQPNSPGINAGNNAGAPGLTDLDGNPRIGGGIVDMGAYEFPNAIPTIPPQILFDDTSFGYCTNRFGFNIRGCSNQVVVVEVSTDLLNWMPLATNTLGSEPLYFCDTDCANFPQRFYRLLAPSNP